ncbi:hypothetical protein IQ05_00984 [Flavobacterium tiangeerense]|uniref:Probable inorganic carbon transporter subunit DabA n=1 Tax=Flavobacterium tiangeerense TaxID=459471 RepID=A0ABY3FMI2_9FLAO|nr:DUF2309 domain-containing protein [Flavobacterium tiangeerense]TWI01403.1 hypothetical protein IQ05_00984 [Flavobacterium tiangeerense]
MNLTSLRFVEEATLHKLSHFLPAQNPLKDFVHHNTLHAFQDKDFFTALQESSEIFGYKTFLPLSDFRNKLKNNQINEAILDKIIYQKKGEDNFSSWKENVLHKNYDEAIYPKIGKLRSLWKEKYAINLDKSTHGILFRILCSYLDQGISVWAFPVHQDGFLASIKELDKNGVFSIFSTARAKKLLKEDTSIYKLLQILVGEGLYFENYLFDQQFSHPGWSGMIATLESNPTSLLDARKITLKELVTFELLLEIDALDKKFGENWEPLITKITFEAENLFSQSAYSEYFEVLSIWQEAFEWTFYNQALTGLQHKTSVKASEENTKFQAFFCMDDRECSFRRHIEALEPSVKTFGVAAFFNFEFFYQPVNGKFFTKLCPAPVTPQFLIKELPRKKKSPKDYHYHKKSHSLVFGWLISQTLGYTSAFKLFLNIFKPSMSPATSASFKHLNKKSKLVIENTNPEEKIDGLQVGFSIEEMANRVEGILKTIGLVENFAPIVYVVGHGATSVNNTHFAGYDCGACSGRPSSVNAKVLSFAANHVKVREILAERGIVIPTDTQFLPALHDTTRDEIVFYDEELLSVVNTFSHKENSKTFTNALANNAKERSRRFDTINSNESISKVHEKIKNRSVSLFEPRPELNHATNAMCIVGRRSVSDHVFLDRRSFMNSFDYEVDPKGDYLAGILNAVAPVGGGINLEYYFSRVDNHKLGAGSKLPHNVMGLIGVANGIDGDLRPGLPSQMIEVHDPLRLLIVVEHFPEIVKYAITKVPATYEWFINNWVNLVALHPETKTLYRFVNGEFEIYQPASFNIQTIDNSLEYAITSSENLNITLLK